MALPAPIHSPDQLARFLVFLEYPRDQVEEQIRAEFDVEPQDAERLVDEALMEFESNEREIDQIVGTDRRAAVAAEHNLDKSMHRRKS